MSYTYVISVTEFLPVSYILRIGLGNTDSRTFNHLFMQAQTGLGENRPCLNCRSWMMKNGMC